MNFNLGVIAGSRIAITKVIPAVQFESDCSVVAIASETEGRASRLAKDFDIPIVHTSYKQLLGDDRVNAVYISVPNHRHLELIEMALSGGKHVLCEKPLLVGEAQVARLEKLTLRYPGLVVMEGFMYRHHPQWLALKALLPKISPCFSVNISFGYLNVDPDNIRNSPLSFGGALFDIGCYCVSVARGLVGRTPSRVLGARQMCSFGVDSFFAAIIDFETVTVTFSVHTQGARTQRIEVFGGSGKIVLNEAFNPSGDVTHIDVSLLDTKEEIKVQNENQFANQIEGFRDVILGKALSPTPLTESLENIIVTELLSRSAIEGRWLEVDLRNVT